jgi:outer membrane protein TolC
MATSRNSRSAQLAIGTAFIAIVFLAGARALQAQTEQTGIVSLDQLILLATQVNPQVRAAKERWASATHQIKQNYAPADPIFTYMNIDSRGFPLWQTSQHTIQIAQPFQFPGKGLLQGDQATRAADIARLAYQATLRDVRAQVEIAYYQRALDVQLGGVTVAQATILRQVEKVAGIGYETNQVT